MIIDVNEFHAVKEFHAIRKLCGLLAAGMLSVALAVGVGALSPKDITAETAVLIDADTGQVLFDKNMSQRMEPASITKIMTGLLVMENCEPEDMVTVTETAVDIPYSSYIALTPDELISVGDAMYALMLPSANDAANALAEHVGGSQAAFADKMNQRAKELGAVNTRFANVHGLPDPAHYTTAYDMAVITRAAIGNPGFLRYFGTGRYTMPATNKQSDERPFTNQQFMLLKDQWPYNPDVIGGKVGYTQEAGNTMSTAATRDGRTLVCVVMKCGIDEKYDDTQLLLDYGFGEFTQHTVPASQFTGQTAQITADGETVGSAVFSAAGDVSVLLHDSISADSLTVRFETPETINKGETPAVAAYVDADVPAGQGLSSVLATVPLTMEATLAEPVSAPVTPQTTEPESQFNLPLPVVIPAAILLVLLIWSRVSLHRKRVRSRRRREAAYARRERRQGDTSFS